MIPVGGERTDRLRLLRHELRTPVNHVIGYTELLLEEAEDRCRPELIPDLRKIHLAARQLLELIPSLFDPAAGAATDPWRLQHDLRTP